MISGALQTISGYQLMRPRTGNYLSNPTFNKRNYPVWTSWNGAIRTSTYYGNTGNFGVGIANWIHYSPVFNQGWSSYVGNLFIKRQPTRQATDRQYHLNTFTTHGFADAATDRVIKMYGSEDLFTGNNPGGGATPNQDLTRSYQNTGAYSASYATPRLVSNSPMGGNGTVLNGSSGALNNYQNWARHEWTQIVTVPQWALKATFGARIKIAADDKLKLYNWCGIYCAEDSIGAVGTGQATRNVNYFGIKKSTDTFTRPTGALTGDMAEYNWNGLSTGTTPQSDPLPNNQFYLTPTTCNVTEHGMLDEDDFEDFTNVEYTFDLTYTGGTNNKIGFTIFFAESIGNMNRNNGDPTGGFQVFNPYLEFSSS